MSLHFLTNFADQAVILPVLLLTGLMLLALGWWRGAVAWFLAVPGTLGVVLVAKLSTLACRDMMPAGLLSPSGHAASAAVVYGGLLALLLGELVPRQRVAVRLLLAVSCGAVVAAVVGFTRVALVVHSLADVLVGGAIGTLGVVVLVLLAGPRPQLSRAWIGVAAAVVAVVVLFHGRHVYAERHITEVSQQIWPMSLCAAP